MTHFDRPVQCLMRENARMMKNRFRNGLMAFNVRHMWRWAACAVLLVGAAACPSNTLPLYAVSVTPNVVYGVGLVADSPDSTTYREKDLLLDVYRPVNDPTPRKPALLLVHGGSFVEGSKEKKEIVDFANFFARRGFVTFSMNYRLAGDNPPAPEGWENTGLTRAAHAAMVDVKAAVRFIHAKAGQYEIDTRQIALLGESAGAIAAVTTAVTNPLEYATDGPDYTIPQSNYPTYSSRVNAYIHLWGNADHVLLSVDPSDPPMMIAHGTEDDNIFTPFASAERLHALLELYNIPHEFYKLEGEGHGPWDARVNGKGLKLLTLDFLNEHLLGKKLEPDNGT